MRNRPMGRAGLLPAVGLGLALALTACGSDDTGTDSGDSSATTETESSAPASESAAAAPAGAEKEVKIGKTLKDPDMGDTIEVVSAIRDFPSKEKADTIAGGGEVVLLQVKIKPGKEYGGLIQDGNFQISWDKGADFWSPESQMAEEMTAAKRTPFEDIARRDGGEATGWIAFEADEKADSYLIEYERAGAKVIGADKEIPEFKKQIEIPAS